MITVDTLSDEQIRELRESLYARPLGSIEYTASALAACRIALGGESDRNPDHPRHATNEHDECASWCEACREQRYSRVRCAEILNARSEP